ncbi:Gfo/Idh/MocA family oxidoreductase [bacterium]|nr:Gfo/Idh/MocA family oxidoreductase [bacterium]
MKRTINVAVVGLRFGGCFPPIYIDHPDVGRVAVCDANPAMLNDYADRYGITERYTDIKDILSSDDFDAVHILTPIPSHAELSLAVLNSGKHCACTVPMATSIDEMKAIVRAQRASGKNYMMMETAAYTYHFLLAREMHAKGEFGRIQLLRGAHYQDMENWPPYWLGLPPMWYATHAVSPLLALEHTRATKVHCFGSGVMRDELTKTYGNPYPAETAIFRLSNGCAAEVTRTLFQTAVPYIESFHVYGERKSLEWHIENEPPNITTMTPPAEKLLRVRNNITCARVAPPDRQDLLPPEIRKYTEIKIIPDPKNPHQSIKQGGGHHGSHPHLIHEFVRSIIEERAPRIDAVTAANWTAAGVCAHESAMKDGKEVTVPEFA